MAAILWVTGIIQAGKNQRPTPSSNGKRFFPSTNRTTVNKFMTTSQRAQFRSELIGDAPMSEATLAYLEQRALSRFYDYVLEQFEKAEAGSDLTKAELARRIRRGPDQVNRLLASPGNWTIGTVARLLAGIATEEPLLSSRPVLGRAPQNVNVIDLLDENSDRLQVGYDDVSETGSSAFVLDLMPA